MATITLYHKPGSTPCHAVRMGIKALGLTVELKEIKLGPQGEQLTPEYRKINPLHTVPALDDNGLVLADSHGILQYLVNAYGKDNNPLYPSDPRVRAVVDQRLLFNLGVLYKAFTDAYYPVFMANKLPQPKDLERFDETLGFLEIYLSQTAYSGLDHLTIADFAISSTLLTAEVLAGHDLSKFPKVVQYLEKCKTEIADFQEITQQGLAEFKEFYDEAMSKAKAHCNGQAN